MNFKIYTDDLPNVKVIVNKNMLLRIETMQFLNEDETTVTLRCAEYIDEFKRGFVCDLVCDYHVGEQQSRGTGELKSDTIKNLVLVHINKVWDLSGYPQIDYIFYK